MMPQVGVPSSWQNSFGASPTFTDVRLSNVILPARAANVVYGVYEGSVVTASGLIRQFRPTNAGGNAFNYFLGGAGNSTLTCTPATDEGSYNYLWGYSVGIALTTGNHNLGWGVYSLKSITSGFSNTGIGQHALEDLTTANGNIGIGQYALGDCNGNLNVALGNFALRSLTTATYCIGIGFNAGYVSTTAHRCVYLGYQAGYRDNTSDRLYIGEGPWASAAEGRYSTLIYGIMDGTVYTNQILYVNASLYPYLPAAAPADANFIRGSRLCFYLNEAGDELKVKVVYADGTTFKTGTIALV